MQDKFKMPREHLLYKINVDLIEQDLEVNISCTLNTNQKTELWKDNLVASTQGQKSYLNKFVYKD